MIGQRLKKLREQFNYSQEQLAEKLSLSSSAIRAYEKNQRQPSHETLKEIAKIFDVTTDYLLGVDEFTEIIKNKVSDQETADKIINSLDDDLSVKLFSKASELKSDKDKQIVLNIIEGFIKGINEDK